MTMDNCQRGSAITKSLKMMYLCFLNAHNLINFEYYAQPLLQSLTIFFVIYRKITLLLHNFALVFMSVTFTLVYFA